MKKLFWIFLFVLTGIPFNVSAANISLSQVVLQGLDKVTGRLSTMTVDVGQKTQFGALDIHVRVCYTRPPEEAPENSAFLEIVEHMPAGQAKVFSGWMFSSSPALSAMEHPVYDVWVLKCQGTPFTAPTPEPIVLENPVEAIKPVSKLKMRIIQQQKEKEEEKAAQQAAESVETVEDGTDAPEKTVSDENVEQKQETSPAEAPSNETEINGESDAEETLPQTTELEETSLLEEPSLENEFETEIVMDGDETVFDETVLE